MKTKNTMTVSFLSLSQNQAFARVAVAAFISQLDPTLEEISDIKTAVSEAVTNSIIHGYEDGEGIVEITCSYEDSDVEVIIKDKGRGIENIEMAREPLYTSKPELERSGMGFTVMESFMDKIEVESKPGVGTTIKMKKRVSKNTWGGGEGVYG